MVDLLRRKLCTICDGNELCHTILKDNPKTKIQCTTVRSLMLDIIKKNCEVEEEDDEMEVW